MYSNKYFPPKYFADRYFGTGSEAEGFVAGTAAGAATVSGTATAIGWLVGSTTGSAGCEATATLRKKRGGASNQDLVRQEIMHLEVEEEELLVIEFIASFLAQTHGVQEWVR